MAIDKVRPFAMENPTDGGTETLPVPTEIDPTEDYVSVHGVALDDLETHLIDRDGNDIQFTDPTVGTKTVDEIQSTARVSLNDTTPDTLVNKIIEGAGTTITEQSDGGNEKLEIVSLFGTDFEYKEDQTESSTTSTSYQQKMRLTVTDIPAGEYYFAWFYKARNPNGNSKEMMVRVQQDDTDTFIEDTVIDSDGEFTSNSGFDFVTLTSGTHYFDIDYKRVSGAAYIKDTRFIFWRID